MRSLIVIYEVTFIDKGRAVEPTTSFMTHTILEALMIFFVGLVVCYDSKWLNS